ncbi:hypothetical protein Naga_100737g2 [Nannochloropsis gaditana]|uniref:Uncharacterized protein n=1 Tax=Nannochloropsis gaditana TaxID=72520 RepID=W7TS32_9STRA|nr:hypothetical protein Naga_100737g2 [Nannochloropsis gaditana]
MDQLGDLDHEKLITAGLVTQGVFVLCYTICSFVVASTANMGFNAVLTALLYIFYVAGTYHVLQRSKMPLAVGFVLGVSVMITFLSLMTAIFWGQLANCSPGYYDIKRYSCTNRSAYSATCAFATLLFLVQLVFTSALVLWRDEFIQDSSAYDDIHGAGGASSSSAAGLPGYEGGTQQPSYNQSSTADL